MDQAPVADAPDIRASALEILSRVTGGLQDEKEMSVLTDEIKEFIVRGLARYEPPSDIAEAVEDSFGVFVSRQQIHRYDPNCARRPAQRWCDLHAATREAFINETAAIGIAHKAVRLRLLDRMTQRMLANHYLDRASLYMEQAARECGGMYERARQQPAPQDVPASTMGDDD